MDIKKTFTEMSILFPLLTLYTIVYFGLMVADFAARETFNPTGGMMMAMYAGLLAAYATDKEIHRWLGHDATPKAGSIFVYLWLLFFLAAYTIRSFAQSFVIPEELPMVALQVLGVFFGSKASKKVFELTNAKRVQVAMGREETVLQLLKEKGQIAKRDVKAALSVSDSTAERILNTLEKKGTIVQRGDATGTYYEMVK